jgi:hypothetical protein
MDKQYASMINNAVNGVASGTFREVAKTAAVQVAPPNFSDSIRGAERDVDGLVDRLTIFQIRLVGSFPEDANAGSGEAMPDGILPAAYLAAQRISTAVRRMHDLIDRIESALPA